MTQVTEHGGGVWSIEVPIPDNPLGHTLVHLLDTDSGPVLIDTGWDDPASWDTLVAGLGSLGVSVADIHGVVITHHHPDHHGLSGQVRDASGAWIAMHAADSAVVRRTRDAEPALWLDYLADKLTRAGAPDEHTAPLREARTSGRIRTLPGLRAALPDREIVPGELLDLAGRRLRAIWTPGHTPGHVCLHLEEAHPAGRPGHGRLFSGDHLLPGITPHIGLYEDPDDATVGDPLGDYLDSLERIGRLAPAEVLPAHQYAFPDATSRVRELLAHHEDRLTGLLALLAVPLTPWQVAERMEWNRPWEQIPYGSRNIAVSEAEAHLRRLVKLGRAEVLTGSVPTTYVAL
ncbi:MBL fold metallo-hydrolase [Streptomyces lunaelactis]|uniref:MBL fold metallo-hydrolase n=1 Tax=Streptomyces lunaelactis TaxID=1535768 RepID=UPI001584A7DF|nr:MBL fold metallo-hydrolase [Streptomyces lunaelactis]NUK04987.1 MBL fold metallo-hydrolase [Streptomyces lunaelactis]NUK11581.1 MBL fold metallo-hydrolase [Streptomyces lunaelactis]NUK20002.1 MBL fold metallo-hydrolase [Streptomyces lunaelactis]NUK37998.1 MBL fold metallo-hydrolase [Streptomyces lunaelactis]NUK44982.1 MBL fold metallo-hydrolase [Streptomyces lunaelactis]